jgi:hypothetical protein
VRTLAADALGAAAIAAAAAPASNNGAIECSLILIVQNPLCELFVWVDLVSGCVVRCTNWYLYFVQHHLQPRPVGSII